MDVAPSCLERVIRILRETLSLREADPVDAHTRLVGEGLTLDSVALLDLVLALERAFECEIDDAEITPQAFATVGSAAELVAAKLAGADRPE